MNKFIDSSGEEQDESIFHTQEFYGELGEYLDSLPDTFDTQGYYDDLEQEYSGLNKGE